MSVKAKNVKNDKNVYSTTKEKKMGRVSNLLLSRILIAAKYSELDLSLKSWTLF